MNKNAFFRAKQKKNRFFYEKQRKENKEKTRQQKKLYVDKNRKFMKNCGLFLEHGKKVVLFVFLFRF